jgi:hypothetical protein
MRIRPPVLPKKPEYLNGSVSLHLISGTTAMGTSNFAAEGPGSVAGPLGLTPCHESGHVNVFFLYACAN